MDFPSARQHLYRLLHQDTSFSVAEAALYIAQEGYPDLSVGHYLQRLDEMAEIVSRRMPPEPYPLRIVKTINQYLYGELGFWGNEPDYYNPDNSFLNRVLDLRTGIPITLSLVYLEIAQRIGFPMEGINFPGHFLIRPVQADMDLYVDPFHQGDILFRQDCRNRLETLYGHPVPLRSEFFAAIGPRSFLIRMLTNLKHIYLNQGNLLKCLAASERILLVDPNDGLERRDRGLLYYQLGRWVESRQDLEDYLDQKPQAQDRSLIHQLLNRMSQNS
ncbi:MAG: transglutaminase-like domain-containing protein [Thermosynechococcaceae cyanobacterium]